MRIFYAFLILMVSTILVLLPFTEAIYDFRTSSRTDIFSVDTAVGVTSSNSTLLTELYNDDMGSIAFASSVATDVPIYNSYNSTSRVLNVTGLTANSTRTLDITYDYDSLATSVAINNFIDYVPFMWMICVIAFAPASLFAIFTGRI